MMEHPKVLLFVIIALASCLGLAYPISTSDCMTAYATWGKGKYKIDLGIFHSEVKPIFLAEFKKIAKFEAYCGSNPDFEIDKDGIVNPLAKKRDKVILGKCLKKTFSLDLGSVVLDHKPKSPPPDSDDDGSEGGGSDDDDDGSDSSLSTSKGDDDGDSEPKLLPSGLRALPIVFQAWFEGIYASGIMTVLS